MSKLNIFPEESIKTWESATNQRITKTKQIDEVLFSIKSNFTFSLIKSKEFHIQWFYHQHGSRLDLFYKARNPLLL